MIRRHISTRRGLYPPFRHWHSALMPTRETHFRNQYDRAFFERQLAAMRRLLEVFPGSSVTEIVVEEQVAMMLFQSSSLTKKELASAQCWSTNFVPLYGIGPNECCPTSLKIENWMEGLTLVIPRVTYYSNWEFHISGHPQGIMKTRPFPDLLAVLAGENLLCRAS